MISIARFLLATCAVTASATAQLVPHQSLSLQAPDVTFVGPTLVAVRDSGRVHVFSSFTKQWATLSYTDPTTQVHGFADHVLVDDGGTITAIASRFGVYTTLPTRTAAPQVVGAPVDTWLGAVVDGNDVVFFSAYTGTYVRASFASTPQVALDGFCGVATDGVQTVGCSAQGAVLVPLTANAITGVYAAGYVGIAEDANAIHAFSATRDAWTTLPRMTGTVLVPTTPRTANLLLQDPTGYRFWSAFTDDVRSIATSGGEFVTPSDHAPVIVEGNTAHAFATTTGTLVSRTFGSAPNVSANSSWFALIDVGLERHAWSGVRGAFATPVTYQNPSALLSHGLSAVAAIQEFQPARFQVYSAWTNRWVVAPSANPGNSFVTTSGMVHAEVTGDMHAFSAQHGTFVTLSNAHMVDSFPAVGNYAGWSNGMLHVWNARIPTWRSHPCPTRPTLVRLHHGTMIAEVGNDVYFYGTYDDRWTHLTMTSAFAIDRADETGTVETATEIIAIGASGQTSNLSNAPASWHLQARRSGTTWHVAGEPGSLAVLILGGTPWNLPLPGLGTLYVDPATAALLALPPLGATGTASLSFRVPAAPYWNGVSITGQAAILPPSLVPYLTSGAYRMSIF